MNLCFLTSDLGGRLEAEIAYLWRPLSYRGDLYIFGISVELEDFFRKATFGSEQVLRTTSGPQITPKIKGLGAGERS